MNASYDIGILYASHDDQSIHSSGNGWVTSFHKFLTALLLQINKRDDLGIELINEENLEKYASDSFSTLITILSDQFFENELLVKMAETYYSKLEAHDKYVNSISRLFKVVKTPIEKNYDIAGLEEVLAYDFYRIDPSTGSAQEFNRFFGSDAERQFWMKLVDMAYDLNHVITSKERKSEQLEKQISRNKTVYLASTGVDMVIQRDIIKRELVRHGYKVLPEHILPKEEGELRKMIRTDIKECRLSIHLIGEDYGYKPSGSEKSVVDIQNEMAEQHNFKVLRDNRENETNIEFNRLIWIPPNMKNVSERQQIFIEDLISNAALLDEAEVLRIPLQELKSIIRSELVTHGAAEAVHQVENHTSDNQKTSIYVMYDYLDAESCKPLLASLANRGYKLLHPSFEGNFVDIRYIHQENLRRCDASFIYQGTATPEWVTTKVQDIMKSPGFGRDKPLKANALYLTGKDHYNKELFSKSKAMVITGLNGSFREEILNPFFSKLTDKV